MGVLGRLGSILGCLGEFKVILGASWDYLWPSGRRLGVVLEASWSRLWGRLGGLGPSWGVMWAFSERLGGILCPMFSLKGVDLGMLSWMPFFNCFLVDFASED